MAKPKFSVQKNRAVSNMRFKAAPINGRSKTSPETVSLHVRGHNGVSKAEVSLKDSWVKEIVTQTWNGELGTERVIAYCGNQLHFPITQRAAVAHVEAEEIEEACYQCLESRVFGECRVNRVWPALPACTNCGAKDMPGLCSLLRGANQGQKLRRDMNAKIRAGAKPVQHQLSLTELDREQTPEVSLPFRGAATAPNDFEIAAASNVHMLTDKQAVLAEDEDPAWRYLRLVGQGRLN